MLLRCLSNAKAAQVVAEAHEGVYGVHQSRAKLHFQIKRMGYYWPTIEVYPNGAYLMANNEEKQVGPINRRYLKRYYP
ncbi:hypothetical protein LIER_11495 [Lithospermum erythrorhizon]|uniref:Uncharacterized protein n=1 Tax=Lithospermum erythrorhizon TaxID=34254 RepID=A0AAV3PPN8_LITER